MLEKDDNMVSLKLFAGTDVGLRENNEDNFIVCPDLVKDEWIVPADNQQAIRLGSRGSLMVVADGMGGQNAGEVASAIAIETVRKMFSPECLPVDVFDKSDGIKSFLKRVISECDVAIKKAAADNPSTYGMGSTIIIAWLIGHKLYVAWLGDSRAYSFVMDKGIARLSKDHSYVQQLVDSGAITEEEAMVHPNSNVITRSLGDPSQKAKADVVEYDVEDGEVVMLCTDGLCGVCSDAEIGGIIEDEYANLQQCKERLTSAALAAGGSDNITVSLMQIHINSKESDTPGVKKKNIGRHVFPIVLIVALCLCALSVFMFLGWHETVSKTSKDSVEIWLDKYTLAAGEKTAFHIVRSGEEDVTLDFDRNLIDLNLKDSTLTVKNVIFLTDTTIFVKATCQSNCDLTDSVAISIAKSEFEVPQQIEDLLNNPPVGKTEVEPTKNDGSSSVGGSVTGQGDGSIFTDGKQSGKSSMTLSPDQDSIPGITGSKH